MPVNLDAVTAHAGFDLLFAQVRDGEVGILHRLRQSTQFFANFFAARCNLVAILVLVTPVSIPTPAPGTLLPQPEKSAQQEQYARRCYWETLFPCAASERTLGQS